VTERTKKRRDWGDYRKLFTQLPPAFERLPFAARSLAAELGRRCDRKGRIIPVDGDGCDGCASHVDDLMFHVRAHPGDRSFVESGLRVLLDDTFLVVANGWLTIRNFEEAQESDSAKRMRAKRASDGCDAQSSPASPGMVGVVCSDPDPEGVQGEPDTVCDGIPDGDIETVCPLDLAERWTGADLMADKLKVPRAEVDRVVTEFVTYWTIGGGTGKRRRHWARLLRQRVAEQVNPGGGPKLSPRAGQPLAALRSIVVED
jgi:hypothetical protein